MDYINKLLHRAAAIPTRTLPSPTPPSTSENTALKNAEHEVKVRFAREFADVGSITYSAPESLSSASSFQSISSTLSTKSSSGICPDSVPQSPNQTLNTSYVNTNISGVEDLILGCAGIHLSSDDDLSYGTLQNSLDLSQHQTFASEADKIPADVTKNLANGISLTDTQNTTESIDSESTTCESTCSSLNLTQDTIRDQPIVNTICVKEPLPVAIIRSDRRNSFINVETFVERSISPHKIDNISSNDHQTSGNCFNVIKESPVQQRFTIDESNLNSTVCLSPNTKVPDVSKEEKHGVLENNKSEAQALSLSSVSSPIVNSIDNSVFVSTEYAEEPSLPSISTLSSSLIASDSSKLSETDTRDDRNNVKSLLARSSSPVNNSDAVGAPLSPRIGSKSPVREAENKSFSLVETNSTSLCNDVTDSEQNCDIRSNDTPIVRPKTPEVSENLSTSIYNETPYLTSSQQLNGTISKEKEIDNNKLDKSLSKRSDEDLENVDVIKSFNEEENERKEQCSNEELDTTLTLQDVSLISETVPDVEQFADFKPKRQSTTLSTLNTEQSNFDELKSDSEQGTNDIFKSSLELSEESDHFISAASEIFQDPTSFDYLINHGNTNTINRLRTESLYVKFDPLVGNTTMLPQGNIQPINEEQNGKNENVPANIVSPKRNPAIAAIDRLLFYSPISTSMTQKTDEPQEKVASKEQPVEKPETYTSLVANVNMCKELELVRATVLQLEEELEKRKKEYKIELEKQKKEYETELEKQKNAFQEKINKLQAQIAQEVKTKSQMTVVVEEYEKSISRLLTERERDRTNFEQEKAKLQEELQGTNVHLANTEAAFNDVHQKYEKLKGFVSVYKNNESVLKESIQENMETIKGLEARYDHLKNHAMTQLEKANFELDAIRKQHEDETVKLHAMVRKAELKSNSLAELVEQKTKENKELTQILDEVIARVGHQTEE
ncbi:Transforming acidic coiled-coil-containing protein 1 [Anthophora plagiata]